MSFLSSLSIPIPVDQNFVSVLITFPACQFVQVDDILLSLFIPDFRWKEEIYIRDERG